MAKKVEQIIATPAQLRALLMQSAVAVIESRMTVAQANAVVGLSSELHKSIKQECDMRNAYIEGTVIEQGNVTKMLGD